MKILKLILFLCIYSLSLSAQIRFAPKLGLNISNQFINIPERPGLSISGFDYQAKSLIGFHIGGSANWYINDFLILQPNVLFNMKGMRYTNIGNGYKDVGKTTLYYLDLPIYLMFKQDVGLAELFIGAGGYYSLGIAGKDEYTTTPTSGSSISTTQNIKWGTNLRKTDYGLTFQGGINFSFNLQLSVFYQLGLKNIDRTLTGYDTKNRNLGISLAYLIGGGY